MSRVDHDVVRLRTFAGRRSEYSVEDAALAPANETVVQLLVWAVCLRRILPPQPIADHIDNATHHYSR